MYLSIKNKTTRYLIEKLAILAQQYKEPYDDHDSVAAENNIPLEAKLKIYVEMLNELMKYE